jgi:hypothetical protein
MADNDKGTSLDWNASIEHDGKEFILLPEGDYPFEVKKFERGYYKGGEKIGPCNMAKLTLLVGDRDSDQVTIQHNLMLSSKLEGILCEFFKSIGARKHGERLEINWNKIIGEKGHCHVIIDKFISKNTGKELESNKVKYFIDPEKMAKRMASAEKDNGELAF